MSDVGRSGARSEPAKQEPGGHAARGRATYERGCARSTVAARAWLGQPRLMRRSRAAIAVVLVVLLLAALRLRSPAGGDAVLRHTRDEQLQPRLAIRRAIEAAVGGHADSAAIVQSAMDDAVQFFMGSAESSSNEPAIRARLVDVMSSPPPPPPSSAASTEQPWQQQPDEEGEEEDDDYDYDYDEEEEEEEATVSSVPSLPPPSAVSARIAPRRRTAPSTARASPGRRSPAAVPARRTCDILPSRSWAPCTRERRTRTP